MAEQQRCALGSGYAVPDGMGTSSTRFPPVERSTTASSSLTPPTGTFQANTGTSVPIGPLGEIGSMMVRVLTVTAPSVALPGVPNVNVSVWLMPGSAGSVPLIVPVACPPRCSADWPSGRCSPYR